jgi:hypothetical protein
MYEKGQYLCCGVVLSVPEFKLCTSVPALYIQLQNWTVHHSSPGRISATKTCAAEYENRNVCILSDSHAAIKALETCQISSKLVFDCYQSCLKLAERNRVQLICVPGYREVEGNEVADRLARMGSELACCISVGVAKKPISYRMNHDTTEKYWEAIVGHRHVKVSLQGPSAIRTREVL